MKTYKIIIALLLLSLNSFADGVLTSQNENYPGFFLKNKSTEITVNINGLVVETIVKQEFENEWSKSVDATYSFPVPLNSRVTSLLYSKGDTLVNAILDVMPQSTNPGTGSNETIAKLNEYMGQNVIRLKLTNILPNKVKWVELHYISVLKHANGTCSYKYPFDTKSFLTYPLDYLKIDVNVHSDRAITGFDMPSNAGFYTLKSTSNDLKLVYLKQQVYPAADILFNYTIQNSLLNIDFYSTKEENKDGYFTLIGRPQISTVITNSFPLNVIFLLGNSSSMTGNKLNQSKQSIAASLDKLSLKDSFNIVLFNSSVSSWQTQPVVANASNISSAKEWLAAVNPQGGSDLNFGLKTSINQLKVKTNPTSILVFADGISSIVPTEIETLNTKKTGIFVIAIGNKIDRLKLEKLTSLNYGFVSYISESDNLAVEMKSVFDKIRFPILKNINVTCLNSNQLNLYPSKFPAIYANSDFIVTGRYKTPGLATINIDGFEIGGYKLFPYQVNFSNTSNSDFARKFWTKYAIDDKEADILINGDNPTSVQALINLSLYEKMRCRYTAYVEDTTFNRQVDSIFVMVETPKTSEIVDNLSVSKTEIKIYPNPASDDINLLFTINQKDAISEKYVKIYDLAGVLLYTIDLTKFKAGTYHQTFNLSKLCNSTQMLIFRLEIGGKTISTVNVLKI
jgi:Ca-activated chloride channel family protein